MSRIQLAGVDGSNPVGFLAAIGLLRVVPDVRIGFVNDGSFQAFLERLNPSSDLAALIAADALSAASESAPWRLTYSKAATKKQGSQTVSDLKPPPHAFKSFLANCIEAWRNGDEEPARYAACYGTDIAVDGKGNTKPTAFHFTAAQQTFLGTVDSIRASLTPEWVKTSLFTGYGARPGSNLRWDPNAERSWALMAKNPNSDGTRVDAPLEWLAFRGLALLPCFPRGSRLVTTGVVGRGNEMTFNWPLWSTAASLATTRSALQLDWTGGPTRHRLRGVFAVCSSTIRRTSQGFGNFGPSSVTS